MPLAMAYSACGRGKKRELVSAAPHALTLDPSGTERSGRETHVDDRARRGANVDVGAEDDELEVEDGAFSDAPDVHVGAVLVVPVKAGLRAEMRERERQCGSE
mgnify:CR=1 FL=1